MNLHLGSFNSGELSPLLLSRFGVEKVASGCRQLKNFLIHVHGPAFRRPGLEYRGAPQSQDFKSRLYGFTFSTTTGFILEFCEDGLKVWGNGDPITLVSPCALPYSEEECFELQTYQVNDVVYLVHPNHAPRRLIRYADGDWQLEEVPWSWPPLRDENVTDTTVAVNAGVMTASAAIFQAGHVGSFWQVAHRRELSSSEIVEAAGAFIETTSTPLRIIGQWDLFTYGIWSTTVYLEREDALGGWEVIRSWSSEDDRNVVASGVEYTEANLRLRVAAGDATGTAGARWLLEAADSKIYGLVKVTAFNSTTSVDVDEIASVDSTDPTALWTEGAFSGVRGYPRTIGGHLGRTWYAGTSDEPQRLWASVTNDFDNFRRSSLDDSSLSFAPSASERNEINWIASQGEALLMGTSGEEWMIHGDGKPITPTNIQVERQSRFGSGFLPAQMVDESVVFVQRGSKKIRRIGARSDADPWTASDLTTLAEHITAAGIVQTAYTSTPLSILWAVTTDGKLLGMTYEREQNVYGWHVHETDGLIESVAVVHSYDSDEVWVTVLRDNGRTVERLDPVVMARDFSDRALLNYLDSSVITTGTDLEEVTGLTHLEGLEVDVLADGSYRGSVTVAGGTVAIDPPADTVIVGLPFTSILQPMRIEVPLQDGSSQHRMFRVHKVGLFLHWSLSGEVADGEGSDFEELLYRSVADDMGSPPPLFTGEKEATLESEARSNVDILVRQNLPLPLNVGAITIKLDVYGE